MLRGIAHSLAIIAGFVALGFAAAWLFAASPCQSGWCPSYKCFGPCGGNCRCVSRDYSGGTCVDIQHSERLVAQGWRELQ